MADLTGTCAGRRAVLGGLGVVGVVALAGCGDDAESRTRGSRTPNSGGPGSGGPSGSGGSGGPGGGGPSGMPGATPTPEESIIDDSSLNPWPGSGVPNALVKVGDVPVGGAVLVRDSTVVTQPVAGEFRAFDARCPHQGFTIDTPVGGSAVMVCPGHGSTFRVADGSRVSGPATRGLTPVAVAVKDGHVTRV